MIKILIFAVVVVSGVVSKEDEIAQPSQHYESTDYIRHYEPYPYPVHYDRRDNRHDRHHHDRDQHNSYRHRGHDDRHHRDRHDDRHHRDRHDNRDRHAPAREYVPYTYTPHVEPKVEVNPLNHGYRHDGYVRSGEHYNNHIPIVPKEPYYIPPLPHVPYVERKIETNYPKPNYGLGHYAPVRESYSYNPYIERKIDDNYVNNYYPTRDYKPVKEPQEPYNYYNPYGINEIESYGAYENYI